MNSITRILAKAYGGFSSARLLGAVAVSSFRAPLLGLAVHADGMGKAAQPGSCHAVFHHAWEFPRRGRRHYLSPALSFFGGVLLILGLASRLTGLVLTGNMLVAYFTADREALLSLFSDPGKFYGAAPYTFLFAAVADPDIWPGMVCAGHLDCAPLRSRPQQGSRSSRSDAA